MRPDSLLRLWSYINYLLTYLLTKRDEQTEMAVADLEIYEGGANEVYNTQ